MKPLIIDTSIWVEWLRGRASEKRELISNRMLLMPSIVEMELLSGVRGKIHERILDKLLEPFRRNRRIIVPSDADYRIAGSVLSELRLPASKAANDVLICVCALKTGSEIWTLNHRDFSPIGKNLSVTIR